MGRHKNVHLIPDGVTHSSLTAFMDEVIERDGRFDCAIDIDGYSAGFQKTKDLLALVHTILDYNPENTVVCVVGGAAEPHKQVLNSRLKCAVSSVSCLKE